MANEFERIFTVTPPIEKFWIIPRQFISCNRICGDKTNDIDHSKDRPSLPGERFIDETMGFVAGCNHPDAPKMGNGLDFPCLERDTWLGV